MSRSELYAEAKALGLNVEWRTCDVYRLKIAIANERAKTQDLGLTASFEEQFDHVYKPEQPIARANVSSYSFGVRVEAAGQYVELTGGPMTVEALREAAVLLVGDGYSLSHPLNPQENVERLRTAKRTVLLSRRDHGLRRRLLNYIMDWEAALTEDEIAIYLG